MTRGRTAGLLAALAGFALAYELLAHWLSTARDSPAVGALSPYAAWAYYLQHVVIFCGLAAAFGLSLRPGRESLVTRLARLSGDALGPAELAYTRRVTLAWALFSLAMLAASTLLFLLAPIDAWSVFANLLSLPLVGAMFAAEFAVRLRLHPRLCHGGVLRSVRAFLEHGAGQTSR